jgi:hypothetical protein
MICCVSGCLARFSCALIRGLCCALPAEPGAQLLPHRGAPLEWRGSSPQLRLWFCLFVCMRQRRGISERQLQVCLLCVHARVGVNLDFPSFSFPLSLSPSLPLSLSPLLPPSGDSRNKTDPNIPFVFNLEDMLREQRDKLLATISHVSLPLPPSPALFPPPTLSLPLQPSLFLCSPSLCYPSSASLV